MARSTLLDKLYTNAGSGFKSRLMVYGTPGDTAFTILNAGIFGKIYKVVTSWTTTSGTTTTAPTVAVNRISDSVNLTVTVAANYAVVDELYIDIHGF
jgi:hypothetical protein